MPPSATGSHAALCCAPPASCNILQIDVFKSGGKLLVSVETQYHKSLAKKQKTNNDSVYWTDEQKDENRSNRYGSDWMTEFRKLSRVKWGKALE